MQSSCDYCLVHIAWCDVVQYVRDVFRLLGDDKAYKELGEQALDYTLTWIDFVLEKCERGRGTPPRFVKVAP